MRSAATRVATPARFFRSSIVQKSPYVSTSGIHHVLWIGGCYGSAGHAPPPHEGCSRDVLTADQGTGLGELLTMFGLCLQVVEPRPPACLGVAVGVVAGRRMGGG